MSAKYGHNKIMIEFIQRMLTDTAVYPYALIRDYEALGLDAAQVLLLLRILHPYYSQGELTLADVAAELAVSEDEAKIILLPYFDKQLLEEDQQTHQISCNGIMEVFYEKWISEQRQKKTSRSGKKAAAPVMIDKELIRNLTRLFHAFEQELGHNLSPIQSEEIRSWLEQDQMPPELIEEALKRAVLQEKRSFAYIKSILAKWREAGYATLEEVLKNDLKPLPKGYAKPQAKRKESKKSQYHEIYDKY